MLIAEIKAALAEADTIETDEVQALTGDVDEWNTQFQGAVAHGKRTVAEAVSTLFDLLRRRTSATTEATTLLSQSAEVGQDAYGAVAVGTGNTHLELAASHAAQAFQLAKPLPGRLGGLREMIDAAEAAVLDTLAGHLGTIAVEGREITGEARRITQWSTFAVRESQAYVATIGAE